MTKILVTGGAGFIGSNLVDALIEKNYGVSIIDDLSTGSLDNVNKKAKLYKIDISNKDALVGAMEEIDPEIIFHLAAQINVRASLENPERDKQVNVIGTLNLIDLAPRLKHFIFSSTGGAIYGENAPRPTPETTEAKPVSPYGIHKLESENNLKRLAHEKSFKLTVLRYANVYGPRQNAKGEAGVISIFTTNILANKPIRVFGTGEQTRDYVYVQDVVSANLKALEGQTEGIFNIGTSREVSLNEIIKLLGKNFAKKLEVVYEDAIKGELMHSSLDCSLARQTLGWSVECEIEEGLKKTIEYFQNASS